jgi:hypothetical protein
MKGMRTFYLTILAMILYTVILVVNKQVDPLSLGIGFGFILAPKAYKDSVEYKFNGSGK